MFRQRPCLRKPFPGFMEGAYRSAMRVAPLPNLIKDDPRGTHCSHRGVGSSSHFHGFSFASSCSADLTKGDWASLWTLSMDHDNPVPVVAAAKIQFNLESRAARAEALIHMGELSAARQAFEGAAGTRETLTARDASQFCETPFRLTSSMQLQQNSSHWPSTCCPQHQKCKAESRWPISDGCRTFEVVLET